VPLGLHSCRSGGTLVSSIPSAQYAQEGNHAPSTARTYLHSLPAAIPEDHLLDLRQRADRGCRMRLRPRRSSIGYGFLLGAMVTVDVLLLAAIIALHRLQAWLAL
jgi:hypothetical protein